MSEHSIKRASNRDAEMSSNAAPKTSANLTNSLPLNTPRRWRAGVLGATGLVGQRLVKLLANHPWFELTEVAASERSSGKSYAEAVRWHLDAPIPEAARDLVVKGLDPSLDCDFVFSALDSSVAGAAEEDFARAGYPGRQQFEKSPHGSRCPSADSRSQRRASRRDSACSKNIAATTLASSSPTPIVPRLDSSSS